MSPIPALTFSKLIEAYKTDPLSPFHELRERSRINYGYLLDRIDTDHGYELVADVTARIIREWHAGWLGSSDKPKIAMAHSLVGMVRTICSFGTTMLEDNDCTRLSTILSKLRFKMSKPRTERLTAEQVIAIRAQAHKIGRPSIALAQAFQFECTFRQKDCIGERVAETEPGPGIIIAPGLRHTTSKRQKYVEIDLKLAQMVLDELPHVPEAQILSGGPIIIDERTGQPWKHYEFRRQWRKCATAAGVPLKVFNMDTRSGAITEALLAGVPIDAARKAATHTQTSQTANYSRGDAEAIRNVMRTRAQSREAA